LAKMENNIENEPPTPKTENFEDSPKTTSNNSSTSIPSSSDEKKKNSSVKSVGVFADKNSAHRRKMEDSHVIIDNFGENAKQGYFAIYDGHGGRGAVDFVEKNLHLNLLSELPKNDDVQVAFSNAFSLTDKQLGENKIEFSGACVVSALITQDKDGKRVLHTANCGDARAVLIRKEQVVRLTYDHKATDTEEIERIKKAGGFIMMERVNGMLAVTRSLGDRNMKDFIISEPYQKKIELEETDSILILACDGLWDTIKEDQDVYNLIKDETDAQRMSEKLLVYALKNGSTDNISVMVVFL